MQSSWVGRWLLGSINRLPPPPAGIGSHVQSSLGWLSSSIIRLPPPPPAGIGSRVQSSLGWLSGSINNMWSSMKEKDPSTLQHKMHVAGERGWEA